MSAHSAVAKALTKVRPANHRLVILDPGLNELGGHHPATLESIKAAVIDKGNIEVQLYCHQNCSADFISQQSTQQINSKRHFTTPYYRFFYAMPSYAELSEYTLALANEYQQAILTELDKTSGSAITLFWCHTLNWEHATALALALTKITSQHTEAQYQRFRVNVGLMYHPLCRAPKDEDGRLQHEMRHELAFKRLANLDTVSLFAADKEIQHYYQQRFGCRVGIQPCLLLGSTSTLKVISGNGRDDKPATSRALALQSVTPRENILLFVGDAKENKGFTDLPQLIEQLVPMSPTKQFVVQYSNCAVSESLTAADRKIKQLRDSYPNLMLIDRFLTHSELMALFQSSQTVLLNYDETTYQLQSSGVLWLAAFFNLKVISLSQTWMSREAVRLGVDYRECQTVEQCLDSLVESRLNSDLAVRQDIVQQQGSNHEALDYAGQLFTDIGDWLDFQFSIIK